MYASYLVMYLYLVIISKYQKRSESSVGIKKGHRFIGLCQSYQNKDHT